MSRPSPLLLFALLACTWSSSTAPAPAPTPSTPTAAPLATQPAAAPAPYDLPSDLARLTSLATSSLGERAVTRVVGDVFLLAAPTPGPLLDDATQLLARALPAYFNGARFTRAPDRAVTVFLFPTATEYRTFARSRPGAPEELPRFGYYSRRVHEAVVSTEMGIETLTHEIVHPIVARDFPAAPLWFDEGLGALFENPSMPSPGEIHGNIHWRRRKRLFAALASPKERDLVRLDLLFAMTDDAFHAKGAPDGERAGLEELHYAMAREACQWLDERTTPGDARAPTDLWRLYRAWREAVADDPTGEKTFAIVVGTTPRDATAAWLAWVRGGPAR